MPLQEQVRELQGGRHVVARAHEVGLQLGDALTSLGGQGQCRLDRHVGARHHEERRQQQQDEDIEHTGHPHRRRKLAWVSM